MKLSDSWINFLFGMIAGFFLGYLVAFVIVLWIGG